MFAVSPALIQHGLDGGTLGWLARCDRKDPWDYLVHLNALVKRGRAEGWWDRLGELWIFGSESRQAALGGLKGFRIAANMTVGAGIAHTPLFGFVGDPALVDFINTGAVPLAYPGVALDDHSLWVFVTSNKVGNYQEAGASGTAGLKSFMLRASSGFRSGIWSANDQFIFGGSSAVGMSGFSRLPGVNGGFTLRDGVELTFAQPAVSMPNANLTILSAEPGASNSPNTVLMVALGASLTTAQAQAFYEAMTLFVQGIGIADDIIVPPEAPGPNCFGKASIQQVLPTTPVAKRVYRQANYPGTDAIDGDTYRWFPITDAALMRSFTSSPRNVALGLDALNVTAISAGASTVVVSDPAHGCIVDDVVRIYGAAAFNGLSSAALNRWHRMTAVTTNSYTIVVPATAAGTGVGGGAAMTVAQQLTKVQNRGTFTIPRGGRLWSNVWSPRGERDVVGGPITSGSVKPNDINPGILRETAPFVGIQCRPAFTTKQRAVGALLVQTAYMVGYLDRTEPRDPRGWGYLDYADHYDLDTAKVQPWWWFAVNRETVFDTPLAGYAACYDHVWLTPKRLNDAIGYTAAQLGVMMDMEHADQRDPDLWERDLLRWGEIVHAVGYASSWIGHVFKDPQANSNGFRPGPAGNAPRIVNSPLIDYFNIISNQNTAPEDFIAYCEAQRSYVRNAAGVVPDHKILLSATLGIGSSLVSPANAERLYAEFILPHNINHVHIRRSASTEGGPIDKPWNQLLVRYLPNLGGTPAQPADAAGIVDLWISALVEEGTQVSDSQRQLMLDFVGALVTAALWPKLDMVSVYACESQAAALKDVKRRTNSVLSGNPVFVPFRHFAFDGVDDYLSTGFVASLHAQVMTPGDTLLSIYLRNNLAVNTVLSLGGINNATVQGLRMNPRTAGNLVQGEINSAVYTIAGATDSRGLTAIQRRAGSPNVYSAWKNGVQLGTAATPATEGAVHTSRELMVGALNSNGTINGWRADQAAMVILGTSLTAPEHAALYAAVQAYMTAVGGAV